MSTSVLEKAFRRIKCRLCGKVGPVIATIALVVIPMVASLRLQEATGTVLVLESALTDVLCIVGVFALLHVVSNGDVGAGKLLGGVLASLIFAAVLGIVGGVGWLLILGKVRDFPNTISTTIAYAFLIYGLSEFLGFSGAIAAMDIAFYREAVFLLKTYFFIYLGISIQFSDSVLALIRDTAYMVVLVSIALCAVLIMAFSARPVQSLYAVMLGKRPSTGATDAQ